MTRRVVAILAASLVTTVIAACGSDDEPQSTSDPSTVTTTTSDEPTSDTTTRAAESDDPQVVAEQLKAAIPEIDAIVKITEDNDANDLIGRPGQYDAATFMEDKRLGCSSDDDFDELSTECGAKIERWSSEADAQARADDIQQKLKDYGLGAEYNYVRDTLLLRVAGAMKPSDAAGYEEAFLG